MIQSSDQKARIASYSFHPSRYSTATLLSTQAIQKPKRLYYLDWLRVLAFGILITAHSAEVFADWHWWLKNEDTSSTVGHIITFFRQWRMPLLFMISGTAVSMALGRKKPLQFLNDRFMRLLLPLIAGMLLVIPPQLYYIRLTQGYTGNFIEFMQSVFSFEWFPNGNFHWMHLWYLAFVFAFTIGILPLLGFIKSKSGTVLLESVIQKARKPVILFSTAIVLSVPYYIIDYLMPRSNLASLANYFPYFLIGALFFSEESFREQVKKISSTALLLAISTAIILFSFFFIESEYSRTITQHVNQEVIDIISMPLETLNAWFWLIAIFGYAMRYLNFGTSSLSYANKAVYPFYILHQTVIVVIGYYIVQLELPIVSKFSLILLSTILVIWGVYELILKKNSVTRLFFGISG